MTPWEAQRIRELYGMTQDEFADALGLEGAWRSRTIRRFETGRQAITGTTKRCYELLREKKERRRKA